MENSKYRMNIGGASILLLIAVFAMTVFAVLSIRASYNELQIAEKNRDSVEAYYEADAIAESTYAALCDAWQAAGIQMRQDAAAVLGSVAGLDQDIIFEAAGEVLDYFVKVDYNRTIQVTLHFSAEGCHVAGWHMVAEEIGSYNGEIVEVWDGVVSK